MTRLPAKWEAFYDAVADAAERLVVADKQHTALLKMRVQILATGGLGWATRLGQVNAQITKAWEKVRVLLLKLYERQTPV